MRSPAGEDREIIPVFLRRSSNRDDRVEHRRGARPPLTLPLNSFTNVAAYADDRWRQLFQELGTYSRENHIFGNPDPPNVYRKGWEWTQTIYGLERLGMIKPQY
jgi:hypothetical protein